VPSIRVFDFVFALRSPKHCFAGSFRLNFLSIVVAFCILAPRFVQSQESKAPAVTNTPLVTSTAAVANTPVEAVIRVTPKTSARQPVESEISVTGMIPFGDYRLYSATIRCNAWTVGVEYDRHSWGYFMKSQFDYVVEVIPIFLLSEPAKADFWGNPKSPNQQWVPGVSVSPFGFRMLWRPDKAVRPYIIGKLGAAVFPQKVLSPAASYANFNVQADLGFLIRMTERVDLRIDPFVFFHVSNGYLAASNPGMDELATKIGISYHLGKQRGNR
jgi:Lipid A 3-O-deacylase (PagL)